jgi:hypothetical protein
MTSYYYTHRSWFKEYYRVYYLKHRQEQIEKAKIWNITHPDRHAAAVSKHLTKNKKTIYGKRRVKYIHNVLMRELLDYFN